MQTRKSDAATVHALLAAAVAAPSIHNTQPWRFGLDPDTGLIQVRLDRRRPLPRADPRLRAQHLSVGAAVFNLRVAAEHLGWDPVVRLCPAPDDPDLLATVRLARPVADAQLPLRDLYEQIERRHTSRMPFTGRPVPEPIVCEMTSSARAEGAHLEVPDIIGTRRLLRLTQAAEARNAADPARADEERTWITLPGGDATYGVPITALGARDVSGRMPVRDFTGGLSVPRLPALRFERHAQVALLWTPYDWREDWLESRAGPGAGAAHGDPARGAYLGAAPGDGVAGPTGGDGRSEAAVRPAGAHPLRIRHRRGPTPRACADLVPGSATRPDPEDRSHRH